MRVTDLKALLDEVPDTRELVLRRTTPDPGYGAWSDASEEAEHAYWRWRHQGGAEAYAVYRAAQDRADAAQDALAFAAAA